MDTKEAKEIRGKQGEQLSEVIKDTLREMFPGVYGEKEQHNDR